MCARIAMELLTLVQILEKWRKSQLTVASQVFQPLNGCNAAVPFVSSAVKKAKASHVPGAFHLGRTCAQSLDCVLKVTLARNEAGVTSAFAHSKLRIWLSEQSP